MTKLQLYTYPNNSNVWKCLVAAEFGNVKIELLACELGKTNKTPEYLEMIPTGKVPGMVTPEGGLFESDAMARYVAKLADPSLAGTTNFESAQIDAWMALSTGEVWSSLLTWLLPYFGFTDFNKQKQDQAIASLRKALTTFEGHLKHHTYLVGDRVTLADIVAGCNAWRCFTQAMDADMRKDFPCVERWFLTLAHHPAFVAVWGGKTQLCETPLKLPPKAPKEGKTKQAPESKPEKPKEAPKLAPAPADDEDEKPAKVEKAKNPLDQLPPSKMMLDSWKRLYSNTPAAQFRQIAIKGLWEGADVPKSLSNEHFEGYDPEGFSFWFCDYKYNEENTVNFIVMNKVGGFLQRLDYVRKYAFGVICILKNDQGQFPIKGVWIFRGQEIPPIMQDECVDLELYDWKKVDLSNPAQKKLVEDMIVEEDKIDGVELLEAKVFK